MFSGECVLIIDGRRFEHCTCAMEEDDGSERSFGFLSAPSALLNRARAAQRVEIRSGDRPPLEIAVLTVNAGIALFAVAVTKLIRVTLASKRWVSVVEGIDVRDLCIRAETQLRESGPANDPIDCQVLGCDRENAAAIVEYLKGVQLSLTDLDHMPISPGVIHTLQLANVERYWSSRADCCRAAPAR
jgi:hypothetical protein